MRITVSNEGSTSVPDQELTVAADNGIVAVDDGGTWAGCTDLVLPYPPLPLALVAAYFDPDGPITYLTFNRAVGLSEAVASEFAYP